MHTVALLTPPFFPLYDSSLCQTAKSRYKSFPIFSTFANWESHYRDVLLSKKFIHWSSFLPLWTAFAQQLLSKTMSSCLQRELMSASTAICLLSCVHQSKHFLQVEYFLLSEVRNSDYFWYFCFNRLTKLWQLYQHTKYFCLHGLKHNWRHYTVCINCTKVLFSECLCFEYYLHRQSS